MKNTKKLTKLAKKISVRNKVLKLVKDNFFSNNFYIFFSNFFLNTVFVIYNQKIQNTLTKSQKNRITLS